MKSYVIQYNAAECSFRNEKEKEMFVVYLLGYMKSDLYFIYVYVRLEIRFSIEGIYFLIFSLNLEENTFFSESILNR